jgi:hypothetical protein
MREAHRLLDQIEAPWRTGPDRVLTSTGSQARSRCPRSLVFAVA